MSRPLAVLSLLTALWSVPAAGQAIPARSADYLFIATAEDVRAIWLNPAGLASTQTSSLMAEFVIDSELTGDARLGQWSAGLSSRGLAFAYQRDRFPDTTDTDAFRIATGFPFPRGSMGLSVTFYRSDNTQRGLDFGFRYHPAPPLGLAAVVRHVGRPGVRGERLPVTGILGAGWWALPPILQFAGEVQIAERAGRSGTDVVYRFGTQIAARTRLPVRAFAAFDVDGDFSVDRWALGVSLGGPYRGAVVASGDGSAAVNRVSLTGLAVRDLGRRR